MQSENQIKTDGGKRPGIPAEVVKILFQASPGNVTSMALSAIANYTGAQRRGEVLKLLQGLSVRIGDEVHKRPIPGSELVRDIIRATLASLENFEDRVRFLGMIANCPNDSAPLMRELKFTAGTLIFDMQDVDDLDSYVWYVDAFVNLFVEAGPVTDHDIADYWHVEPKSIAAFFSKKSSEVVCSKNLWIITCVLEHIKSRIGVQENSIMQKSLGDNSVNSIALRTLIRELAFKHLGRLSTLQHISVLSMK